MTDEQEHKERPKPRVVDKRVSSRPEAAGGPSPSAAVLGGTADAAAPPAEAAPRDVPSSLSESEHGSSRREPPQEVDARSAAASEDRDRRDGPAHEVWTPEQEEEMRAMAQHIAETPSLEWVLNTAVTLANVAGTKLDLGAVADAQLAIDGLGVLIEGLGPRLGTAEAPLRQTLAQLRMAYAEMVAPPPATP